jgi:hypothetical protein
LEGNAAVADERKGGSVCPENQKSKPLGHRGSLLVALAAVLIALLIGYFIKLLQEGRAPSSTGVQTISSSPLASRSASGTAASGTIRMDRLIAGLVELEEEIPLSDHQKKKIREIMLSINERFDRIAYLSKLVEAVLTESQKRFLAAQVESSVGTGSPLGVLQPHDFTSVRGKLIKMAGLEILSAVPLPEKYAPRGGPPPPGKPAIPALFLLVNLYDVLEKNKDLVITQGQAKKLIPILNAYDPSEDQARQSREVLALLTKDQREAVDRRLEKISNKPEVMREYPSRLEKILNINQLPSPSRR